MIGSKRGAEFVIRGPNSKFIVVGGSHLLGPSFLGAKLQVAWTGIVYVRLTLRANQLVIETPLLLLDGTNPMKGTLQLILYC